MEYLQLFTGYRNKQGDLAIVVTDTEVASLMPMKFWDMIVKTFEELKLKNRESYFNYKESDRNKVDNMINIIKEQLKENLPGLS